MERHSLRALVSVVLLVILAWLGIALFDKMHSNGAPVVLVVLWAIAVGAVLGFAVWSFCAGAAGAAGAPIGRDAREMMGGLVD